MFVVSREYANSNFRTELFGIFPTGNQARAKAELLVACAVSGNWMTSTWYAGTDAHGHKFEVRVNEFGVIPPAVPIV